MDIQHYFNGRKSSRQPWYSSYGAFIESVHNNIISDAMITKNVEKDCKDAKLLESVFNAGAGLIRTSSYKKNLKQLFQERFEEELIDDAQNIINISPATQKLVKRVNKALKSQTTKIGDQFEIGLGNMIDEIINNTINSQNGSWAIQTGAARGTTVPDWKLFINNIDNNVSSPILERLSGATLKEINDKRQKINSQNPNNSQLADLAWIPSIDLSAEQIKIDTAVKDLSAEISVVGAGSLPGQILSALSGSTFSAKSYTGDRIGLGTTNFFRIMQGIMNGRHTRNMSGFNLGLWAYAAGWSVIGGKRAEKPNPKIRYYNAEDIKQVKMILCHFRFLYELAGIGININSQYNINFLNNKMVRFLVVLTRDSWNSRGSRGMRITLIPTSLIIRETKLRGWSNENLYNTAESTVSITRFKF